MGDRNPEAAADIATLEIAAAGMRFTAWVAGPEDGALVLLLHGFPQSRHAWRAQLPALAAAGYRAVAPDQRGYSPGARPDAANLANYRVDPLADDAIALAEACGADGRRRFHLVGHDWGGQIAWIVADRYPQRLASLAVLSRPHPAAFLAALDSDEDQRQRSRHHRAHLDPTMTATYLADDARLLRQRMADWALPPQAAADYLAVLGTPAAMEAALAWYRASPGLRTPGLRTPGLPTPVGPTRVPTLYVWGDRDASVGRRAATTTAAQIAAPYRFVELPDIGHFVTDEAPAAATALLLEHLAAHPA